MRRTVALALGVALASGSLGAGESAAAAPASTRFVVPLRPVRPTGPRRARAPAVAGTRPIAPSPDGRSRAAVFSGLDQPGLSGADNSANGIPPDSTGAIGPNDYVEIVNSEIRVYSRTGLTPVSPLGGAGMRMDDFIGHPGDDVFDVQVQWDPQWGVWLYSAADCSAAVSPGAPACASGSTAGVAFGWSKTADPTDLAGGSGDPNSWCHFVLPTNVAGAFSDYPHLGHDDANLVIGANVFPETPVNAPPITAQITVLPKTNPPGSCVDPTPSRTDFGSATTPLTNPDGTMALSPIPANAQDSEPGHAYVVAARNPGDTTACPNSVCSALTLWQVTDGSSTAPTPQDIAVPAYTVPAPVPQPGTPNMVDSLDTRLTQVIGHADPSVAGSPESLWTQHTVADPNDPTGRSVMRWYELLPGSGTPRQTGTVSDPANWVFNGAVSPAGDGSAAATFFDEGGSSQLISVRARGHAAGDAPGATSGEVTLGTSSATDQETTTCVPGPCRWGDYSGASPDPSTPNLVWGTNELNLSSAPNTLPWGTLNFAVSTADQPPTAAFNLTPATASTGVPPISFDGSPSNDPDGSIASWQWSFGDGATGTGRQASHAYSRAGTYTVTLTVTDDHGLTGSVAHSVTITDRPPVADIQWTPATPLARWPVTFDAARSADPDGMIRSLRWSFGDGVTAASSGALTPHTYARPGAYTVTLTAVDDSGNTGATTKQITVSRSCVVPRVKGKRAAKARRLLRRAHCRLGRARRARSARHKPARRLKVRRQKPAPGTVLPVHGRVTEVLH